MVAALSPRYSVSCKSSRYAKNPLWLLAAHLHRSLAQAPKACTRESVLHNAPYNVLPGYGGHGKDVGGPDRRVEADVVGPPPHIGLAGQLVRHDELAVHPE